MASTCFAHRNPFFSRPLCNVSRRCPTKTSEVHLSVSIFLPSSLSLSLLFFIRTTSIRGGKGKNAKKNANGRSTRVAARNRLLTFLCRSIHVTFPILVHRSRSRSKFLERMKMNQQDERKIFNSNPSIRFHKNIGWYMKDSMNRETKDKLRF